MTHKRHHKPHAVNPPRKPDDLPEIHERHRSRWEQRRAHEVIPPEISAELPDAEELQREIQVRAYHKSQERLKRGLPEDMIADWVEAETEVMALWMKHHAHPHAP